MFSSAPDFLIPLETPKGHEVGKKRKHNDDGHDVRSKVLRYMGPNYSASKEGRLVGGGEYKCPTCGKVYVRKWTLERHLETHKKDDSDDEDSEDDNGVEKSDSEQQEDESESDDEEIPSAVIDCLLHALWTAEIGKTEVTTDSLRMFEASKAKGDEAASIGDTAIRSLKELLLAAKNGEIFLSKSLFSNILDGIDSAVEEDDDSEK